MSKISALPLLTSPLGNELGVVLSEGVSKRVRLDSMIAAVANGNYRAALRALYGLSPSDLQCAIWDLAYWKVDLFQDAAATKPVTASGQPVGCIRDRMGDASWDLIAPSDLARPTFQVIDGIPSILPGANQGLLTRGVHSVPTPFYMLGALSQTNLTRFCMGLFSRNNLYHVLTPTTLGRYSALTNIGGQVKSIDNAPYFYTSRPGCWAVFDTLVKDKQADLRTNGTSRFLPTVPVALAAPAGTVVPTAIIGLNIAEQSNGGQATGLPNADVGATFYGGVFLVGEPSQATRDGLVKYFRGQIEPEIRATDKVIFIDGDSTGDGVDESTANIGQELFERWASDTTAGYLRSVYPNDTIYYRNWTSRAQQWTGWMCTQVGTSGKRIFVSNSSVPGSQPSYMMADRFADVFGVHPHIDEVIWNHGHNMFVNYTAVTGQYAKYLRAGEWMDAFDKVRRAYPAACHLAIRTHPIGNPANESIQAVVEALDFVVAEYGDMAVADIYKYFNESGRPAAWYNNDKTHIAEPAGVTAQLDIFAPAYANWQRPAVVAPPRIGRTTTSLLSNSRFDNFDGPAPDDWMKIGAGSVSRSALLIDAALGDNYSVVLEGEVRLARMLDATPYRNSVLTLAVRQYVIAGGATTTGRIQISSNGTGAVPFGNSNYDTSGKPVNAWRWVYHMAFVPADATTIMVNIYGSPGGAGRVHYGRATLVAGARPKDLRG